MSAEINRESYNKVAAKWRESRRQLPLNPCVMDFASRLKQGGNVLDIGCGTGYPIAQYLSDMGFHVTGIDVSESMLSEAVALNLPNASFHLCDFFAFRPAQMYDGVIAFDSLFHFPMERQADIYRIVSGWMNTDGCFLFTHGKQEAEKQDVMYGECFYYSALNTKDVHELLYKHGFSIETSIENYQEEHSQRDLLIVAKKMT